MVAFSRLVIGIIFFVGFIFIAKALWVFYFDISNFEFVCLKFIRHITRAKLTKTDQNGPKWTEMDHSRTVRGQIKNLKSQIENGPKMILVLWMNWLIMIVIVSQSRSCCHIIVLNCVLVALKMIIRSLLKRYRVQGCRLQLVVLRVLTSWDKLRWYWLCSKWPSVWCPWWSWWVV